MIGLWLLKGTTILFLIHGFLVYVFIWKRMRLRSILFPVLIVSISISSMLKSKIFLFFDLFDCLLDRTKRTSLNLFLKQNEKINKNVKRKKIEEERIWSNNVIKTSMMFYIKLNERICSVDYIFFNKFSSSTLENTMQSKWYMSNNLYLT